MNRSPPPGSRKPSNLSVLDVRPILAAGRHPVDDVLAAAETLSAHGVLEVFAPFEPVPLMARLRAGGCSVASIHVDADSWVVRVSPGGLPPHHDLTQLEAPQPLEQVLQACAVLPPGCVFTAWLPRRPMLLFPQLAARGLEWDAADHPGGTAVLWVHRVQP
jgi:hypothetical protein